MRGKVKYVTRYVWLNEMTEDHWKHDVHAVRETHTCAILYNGDKVEISENDIRNYYDRTKITDNLIDELSSDLHNVWIEYGGDDDQDYWLDGILSDYI